MDAAKVIGTILLLMLAGVFAVFALALGLSATTGWKVDPCTAALGIWILFGAVPYALPDPLARPEKQGQS